MGEVSGSIKVVGMFVVVVTLAREGAIGEYFDLELLFVVVIIVAPLGWVASEKTLTMEQEGVELGVPRSWPMVVVPAAKLFVDKGWCSIID